MSINRHVAPEYWVHNLEHGYIVVLYNCPSGCPADVAALTQWYDGHAPDPALTSEKKIIVIPWMSMSSHFAVESWDWYLPLDSADVTKIEASTRTTSTNLLKATSRLMHHRYAVFHDVFSGVGMGRVGSGRTPLPGVEA